jgi:hypothetical protein
MRARRGALGVAAVAALVGCGDDTIRIGLALSGGPAQACPSADPQVAPSCADVKMPCDAVLNIRIVRPEAPEETYLPLCEPIPRNMNGDLCAVEQINLPARELPKETLEVQVMIWPRAAVKEDPDTGALDCREINGKSVTVGFNIDGFPEEIAPAPALGGRAYYRPGDEQTVVTLGCSDLMAVNRPVCAGKIELRASVTELDAPLRPVTAPTAAELLVTVGEPRYVAGRDEHEWQTIKPLDLLPPAPGGDPAWLGAVDVLDTEGTLCVEVIGNRGANTPVLRCGRIASARREFDLAGIWTPANRMAQILAGLSLPEVPPQGLTLGVLLDEVGRPAEGYRIETSPSAVVQYLNGSGQVVPGAIATTASGLFTSPDAPYDSDVRAYLGVSELAKGIGGRVNGKVTVTVLQLGR